MQRLPSGTRTSCPLLFLLAFTATVASAGAAAQECSRDQTKDDTASKGKREPLLILKGAADESFSRVAISPDGKRIAAAGHLPMLFTTKGVLRLWDATTGRQLHMLHGEVYVCDVAFSLDSRLLASADWKVVRVWNMDTGQVVRDFKGHEWQVNSVAFSPDGKHLASGGADKTVRVWELKTGKEVRQLRAHTNDVRRVSYSPDGKFLASAGLDAAVWVSDTATGKEVFAILEKGETYITDVVFSPDGKRLATAATKIPIGDPRWKTVRTWDATTGKQLQSFPTHPSGHTYCVAFSPDGRHLASTDSYFDPVVKNVMTGSAIKIWDSRTGVLALTIDVTVGSPYSLVFSPDGKRLASACWNGTVKIWDVSELLKR